MVLSFDREQVEMVDYIKNLSYPKEESHKKGEWNKYFGDVTNRLVVESLNNHLPKDYLAIGPGAYVEGTSHEFDILIVRKNVSPVRFTNAYPRTSVLAAVEVKKTGIIEKKEQAEEKMRKHRKRLVESIKGIPLFYITFHESEKLIYATKAVFGDSAFFMSTGTNYGMIISGEWKRFVETVLSVLRM